LKRQLNNVWPNNFTMNKKDFKPHKMYHPKTGEAVSAKTYEQHLSLKKRGYGHSAKKKATKKTAQKKSSNKTESFESAVERRVNSKPPKSSGY